MSGTSSSRRTFKFHPLTPERWSDFRKLFGPRGACGGCWCMYWRLTRSEFERRKGEGNRRSMRKIVQSGDEPGILAYCDDEPVGWCAVAPRSTYSTLSRSRVLKPVDERPVWSITCLYVARPYRRQGLSVKLIDAATKFAKKRGAKIVEGYPVEPRRSPMPDTFAYTGLYTAFTKARFREVARRSETRPIVRR